MACGLSVMHLLWDQWITEMGVQIRNVLNVEPEEMTKRIKLTEDNFNVINYYHSDKPAIKCSQEFMNQILENQEKAKRLDSVLGSPYRITYHGAGKYTSVAVLNKEHLRQLLEKEKKWDNFPKQSIDFMRALTLHGEGVTGILTELEQENKQLKLNLDECQRSNRSISGNFLVYKDENDNLKQKLEEVRELSIKEGTEYKGTTIQIALKKIIEMDFSK